MKKSQWAFVVLAIGFGCIAEALSWLSAAFGEGLYFPLGLVSAPFCFVSVSVAFLSVIPLWTVLGWVVACSTKRKIGVALLAVQLISGIVAITADIRYSNYYRINYVPHLIFGLALSLIILYVAWQALLWKTVTRS